MTVPGFSAPQVTQESGGPRFYLTGRGIHAGDVIIVRLGRSNGADLEVPMRFEWSYDFERDVSLYAPDLTRLRIAPREFETVHARWPK